MKSVKEMIEVMQAYDSGKPVQTRTKGMDGPWSDAPNPAFDWFAQDYRVKPAEPDSFDWDSVDCRYDFLARDKNGSAYVFEEEPSQKDDEWWGTGSMQRVDGLFASYANNGMDWRDSLQKRPEAN